MKDLITVYTASGEPQAQLIVLLLESAQIPVQTAQESYGKTLGLTVGPMASVDILVPAERAEEARSLIAAYERGDLEANSGDLLVPPEE